MEAGIEPAHLLSENLNAYKTLIDLSQLCITLSKITQCPMDNKEQTLIEHILTTALSQLCIINTHLNLSNKHTDYFTPGITTTDQSKLNSQIKNLQQELWHQLSFPSILTTIRKPLFSFLCKQDSILSTLLANQQNQISYCPKSPTKPSVAQQVITEPTRIIDPYKRALQDNFYYLLNQFKDQVAQQSSRITLLINPQKGNLLLLK